MNELHLKIFSCMFGGTLTVYLYSALYQLYLVKAEIARTFIPKEFKLVEAFGYGLLVSTSSSWNLCLFLRVFL